MVREVERYEATNMFKLLYVYILKCADNSYYTGVTNSPNERLMQHNEDYNKDSYTFSRRPVELVYLESFWNFHDAVAREKQIKRWTRKKKEAMIANNWEMIKELAQCKNETSHKNHRGVSSFDSAQDDTLEK